jgi:hypothetical protein
MGVCEGIGDRGGVSVGVHWCPVMTVVCTRCAPGLGPSSTGYTTSMTDQSRCPRVPNDATLTAEALAWLREQDPDATEAGAVALVEAVLALSR